jgi:hypothetical protein
MRWYIQLAEGGRNIAWNQFLRHSAPAHKNALSGGLKDLWWSINSPSQYAHPISTDLCYISVAACTSLFTCYCSDISVIDYTDIASSFFLNM